MIINQKTISIPPYISTSWKNISSLHLEEIASSLILFICLKNGTKIQIPGLDKPVIEKIFNSHAKHLEGESELPLNKETNHNLFSFGMPLKQGIEGIESLGSAMQHSPDQGSTPNLPPEVLSKIISIVKVLGIEDSEHLPKPEPHCNCVHCQIAKALQLRSGINEENLDEEVSDEELQFKDWEIKQTGSDLFSVINPLDHGEQYSVFLGNPIGCTCGNKNCEHIKAVLKS